MRSTAITILIVMLWTVPASAHAVLVGTNPKDGASFSSAPTKIAFTFNENIGTPAFISVQAPDGSTVKTSKATAIDHVVRTTVTDVDKRGRYTASYRVVSADGHVVEGTIHYTVTTGEKVKQIAPKKSESFIHHHSAHLFWGILAAAIAVALLLAPLRRHHD